MIEDKIVEVYNSLNKKAFDAIRNDFIQQYGPEILKKLTDIELVKRLFAGADAEDIGEMRGLFSWLEHGKTGSVPKGTFGSANDSRASNGIILFFDKSTGERNYYLYLGNQGKSSIDEKAAIEYASDIKDVIISSYTLINERSFKSLEDYKNLENEIKKLCAHKDNPYWTKNGEFRPLMLKYFHILCPNKISGYYSKNYICKVANTLGIKVDKTSSNLFLNGAITLYMMNIDENMDGIYFAQAVGAIMYKSENVQENKEQEKKKKMKDTSEKEFNLILYGPPGTGKTYNTVINAVEIIDGTVPYKTVGNVVECDYDATLKRYRELVEDGRIAFTTFHQAYGYEEFIEGIKPEFEADNLIYRRADGVFKAFCNKAKKLKTDIAQRYGISESSVVWKVSLGGSADPQIKKDCFANNRIRIGWGSEYTPALAETAEYKGDGKRIVDAFINSMKKGDIVLSCSSATTIDAVGVIDDDEALYGSWDTYKWYRNVKWIKLDINFDIKELNDKKRMVQPTVYKLNVSVENVLSLIKEGAVGEKEDYDYNTPYVFIIDEINRGNIAKIFGELITLIEPSKRLGAEEEMKCTLPYSGEKFGVPKNIYILGTMNTADRSLVQLDAALRRRFAFEEMMPQPQLLKITSDNINLNKLLTAINKRITCLLDREHQIGHSCFMKLNENSNVEDVQIIFKQHIIPLLQEYFFDDYDSIKSVLNGVFLREENNQFSNGRKIFSIEVSNDPEDYQKIYNTAATDMTDNG